MMTQERKLDLFAEALAGEERAVNELLFMLKLEVEAPRNDPAMRRAELLYSDTGLKLWSELVEAEGWRDDERALRCRNLALSFPTLREKIEGGYLALVTWSARELERFSCSAAATSGSKHAAAFVLGVWNRTESYACGPFVAHDALAVWDRPHREAFLAWAKDPWWA